MRIAINGSHGRLGAALARELSAVHETIALDRERLDLSSRESIAGALEPLQFDVLVNCAALTSVDYCEAHPSEAMRVNGEAVADLAEIVSRKGARLIHVSTDYVFDGRAASPRRETDITRPVNRYGESKLLGEQAALSTPSNLVLRVSWVFGPDRRSFIDAIIRRATESDRVEAVADKVSAPTYSLDFAGALLRLLETPGAEGMLHVCNSGCCSWQEYGQHALDIAAAAGMPLRARRVEAISMADLGTFQATRPVHTALSTEKYAVLVGKPLRNWQEAVEAYVRDYVAVPGYSPF